MSQVSSNPKVCTQMLEELLVKEIKTNKEAWRVLHMLATCFVSLAHDTTAIASEVYGNGVPGGLKLDMVVIKEKIERLDEQMAGIANYIEKDKMVKYGRRQGDTAEGDQDTFKSILKWFSDKVLPSLVGGLIIFIINTMLFVSAFMLALANGWIPL